VLIIVAVFLPRRTPQNEKYNYFLSGRLSTPTEKEKCAKENNELNNPSDQTHTHGTPRALVIKSLPYSNNHGNKHPYPHNDIDDPAQKRNYTQNPDDAG